jgi:hypothetical protein
MAVYVDNACLAWRGKRWCHMVADTVHELHEFALELGLKREWFQDQGAYPHYDITVSVREKALALGAAPGSKEIIIGCAKRMRAELRPHRILADSDFSHASLFAG